MLKRVGAYLGDNDQVRLAALKAALFFFTVGLYCVGA